MTEIEEILARLVERVEGRYFGKYRGEVTDNDDPDQLGRIRARVPRLLGEQQTGWAIPAYPYGGKADQGWVFLPDQGASVWIEFEGGDLSYPIWSGAWFGDGELPDQAVPGKKVLKTTSGHKIVFDDDEGSLEITDSNANSIIMDATTIKISTGDATKVIVEGPQIELVENAGHPLVFGDDLLQYLSQLVQIMQTHIHPGQTALGFAVTPMVPGAVFPPPTPSVLSQKVKTG